MPGRRFWLQNRLEYWLARVLLWSLARGTPEHALERARRWTRLLDRAVPRLRRTARENLKCALPSLSDQCREKYIGSVFDSIARLVMAFSRFPSIDDSNVHEWIRCKGMEHVEKALARGHGVLFATAHLGNWELSAFAFALLKQPINVVVRPLDNPLIDALVERYRTFSGNRLITKRDYARGILAALGRNEMVGILADQNDQDGIFIRFFGRPAATSPGLARIAAKTGAAVIPGFAAWSADARKYELRFWPEVVMTGDVRNDTQAIHSAIEIAIREHPGQWLWIHRRWKTQPVK